MRGFVTAMAKATSWPMSSAEIVRMGLESDQNSAIVYGFADHCQVVMWRDGCRGSLVFGGFGEVIDRSHW